MTSFFTEPLAFDFMQRAVAVAVLIGIACALLSCFLVLKGWALMGDAVAHAVLPGIVLAHLLALPLALGAFAAGLSCALLTGYLKETSRLREDALLAVVFTGLMALGLVMFVKVDTDQHLTHILFGNVLGLTWRDAGETALLVLPAAVFVLVRRKDLLLVLFDPAHARTMGLPVSALNTGLLVLLAITIVAALKAVGVVLVTALLVMPGAIGLLLARRFDGVLLVATLAAVFACVMGVLASYHIDVATGPAIVVIEGLVFLAALATSVAGRRRRAARAALAVAKSG
jgi:manganese/iron transport system permease protein